MKISYNWLKELIDGKLPSAQKVAELLTMHSFEVDGIEKIDKDFILDISILPNRAHDCLSHIGIAKEVAVLLGRKIHLKKQKIKENKKVYAKEYIQVDVQDKQSCTAYVNRVITGVRVSSSPAWLVRRLKVLGQNSINNIVDATNYIMLLTGQPLHAFDLDKINGNKIIVRRATTGERIKTLGGQEYILQKDDTVIADEKGALAIAGIKGGINAEVTKYTKNIVLESARFNSVSIRNTSKRIVLQTDASFRFEHGVAPKIYKRALEDVAGLIADITKGTITFGVVGFENQKHIPKLQYIFFTTQQIHDILGVHILEKDIVKIIKNLGFLLVKKNNGYEALTPEDRLDIENYADIAGEVGRIYGFDRISSVLPMGELVPKEASDLFTAMQKIRIVLSGIGFSETYSRSFISTTQTSLFGYTPNTIVTLANPFSEDQKYLRPSLIPHLFAHVRENMKHKKRVMLFEIGSVFHLEKKKNIEEKVIGGIISLHHKEKDIGFLEAKGVVHFLFEKFGINEVSYIPDCSFYESEVFWHGGRIAALRSNGKEIGVVAEINPNILREEGLDSRVVFFEIRIVDILALAKEKTIYTSISKYPAIERDLAVLVPSQIRIDQVQYEIEKAGGAFLYDSDLFDIYEGEHLEADTKSLAFHLVFQSNVKTLTDKEVNIAFKHVIVAIQEKGWEVRE